MPFYDQCYKKVSGMLFTAPERPRVYTKWRILFLKANNATCHIQHHVQMYGVKYSRW